jgi:hypothetical protein
MIKFTLAALLLLAGQEDEKDFTPLFNGKDFTGWKFFFSKKDYDPMQTFSVKDGTIHNMGKPNGYMYTEKKYQDFILRFDWRYIRPADLQDDMKYGGNSGYLLFVQQIDGSVYGAWPKCLEFQGRWKDVAQIFPLGIKAEYKVDKEAREKARKPLGEWNTYEIVSKDNVVTGTVNGVKITTVTKHDLQGMPGHICFQSEDGGEIEWKNIRLKDLGPK